MEPTLREKFESKTAAEKALILRTVRALLADDGGDAAEAEFIANNMGDVLRDLDLMAGYYEDEAAIEIPKCPKCGAVMEYHSWPAVDPGTGDHMGEYRSWGCNTCGHEEEATA